MVSPSRRTFLVSASAMLSAANGCLGSSSPSTPAGSANETTSEIRTPSSTDTENPTQTPTSAADVLPIPSNGWEMKRSNVIGYEMLGGVSGMNAYYSGPDGVEYKVVVLQTRDQYSPEQKAREWDCIGWDVAVSYREYAFAAGTGTEQQTYTPETPPHMSQTPIPGTKTQSQELLSLSPILTEELVKNNAATCDQ